ncbi:MAG: TetR/AcrR family transcriptional regulator [Treponema sp.]|nr:TetR/AcrR family transcriptional regulator [Treponema sp.]
MDRRKQKTQDSIYDAFTSLIGEKDYSTITIQEIIDKANVGRSTFYTHFQTKEDLVLSLCDMLYDHVFESAVTGNHHHGDFKSENNASSIFCHILHHLEENDHNILTLLSCDSSGIFVRYFTDEMNNLIKKEIHFTNSELPVDFLVNHVAATFMEMIRWWIKNGKKETPEQLDKYFSTVINGL